MGNNVVAVFGMLVTIAVIAVIVSQRANTSSIIQAIGSSTGNVITAAVSPLNSQSGH